MQSVITLVKLLFRNDAIIFILNRDIGLNDMTAQTLKIRKIGNSLGLIIPRETQEALRVKEGDVLFSIPTEQGIELTPYDPDFEVAMQAFERTRRKYRNALKELAK